jgi:prephenate dehydratase
MAMIGSAVKTCIRPASRIARNNHIHNNTRKVALLHSSTTTTLLSNKNHNENVINQKGERFTARRLLSTQMSDESHHNQPNGHAYENMNIMEQHHHHHHNLTPPQHQQDSNRTSFLMELTDKIGVLHDILRFFWKYDVNVTRIESRPSKPSLTGATQEKKFDFFVDVQGNVGDDNIDRLLHSLKDFGVTKLLVLDAKQGESFF